MKILIFDDDVADQLLVVHALKKVCKSLDFTLAESIKAIDGDFDFAVLDLHFPHTAGIETIASFCEHYPNLPYLVLSGSDAAPLKLNVPFFKKHSLSDPCKVKELFAAITAVAQSKETQLNKIKFLQQALSRAQEM